MSGPEFTTQIAGRLLTAHCVEVWRELLAPGILSREGLAWLHSRLGLPGEFDAADPAIALLALDVDTALAAAYGNDLAVVPGRELPSPDDFYWPRPGG